MNRSDVHVGMVVRFVSKDLRRAGEVMRLNRKSVVVDAGYDVFTVLYSDLY